MSRDYFAMLGLPPGSYTPEEIRLRFHILRQAIIRQLEDPLNYQVARRRLNEIYMALRALSDRQRQAETLEAMLGGEPQRHLRALRQHIRDSLEDGVLRCSRRRELLEEGRRLGLSEFHVHLLIAEAQFGGPPVLFRSDGGAGDDVGGPVLLPQEEPRPAQAAPRTGVRFAAAGLLGLALFLSVVRWLMP